MRWSSFVTRVIVYYRATVPGHRQSGSLKKPPRRKQPPQPKQVRSLNAPMVRCMLGSNGIMTTTWRFSCSHRLCVCFVALAVSLLATMQFRSLRTLTIVRPEQATSQETDMMLTRRTTALTKTFNSTRRIKAERPRLVDSSKKAGNVTLNPDRRHKSRNANVPTRGKSNSYEPPEQLMCRNLIRKSSTGIDKTMDTLKFDIPENHTAFYGYATKYELASRMNRFPSVEERVKYYMSNWYTLPCENNTRGLQRYSKIQESSQVLIREIEGRHAERRIYLVNNTDAIKAIWHVDQSFYEANDRNKRSYRRDFQNFIRPVFAPYHVPVLVETGDYSTSRAHSLSEGRDGKNPNIPYMRKFRLSMTKEEVACLTSSKCFNGARPLPSEYNFFQPIIWLIRTHRYYSNLLNVGKVDTSWSKKKKMAVFRGNPSGSAHVRWSTETPVSKQANLSAKDECLHVKARCRLVYNHLNSSLIDAKLTGRGESSLPVRLEAEGINVTGASLSIQEMLQYKAVIVIEGNDVASSLKWALLSQSVVMMPPPTCTSWVLEELLEPWIHFIPLHANLTDVEAKMQWVIDNDKEARRIAYRGTLWIKDMFFHPKSKSDTKLIFREMARRYSKHFVPMSPEDVASSLTLEAPLSFKVV